MSEQERKKSVLIVDDTPANLRLLSELLTRSGYQVRAAINGRLALQAVKASLPDIILLDIKMPEMDGYAVCAALKEDEQTREVPVIFISALGEAEEKVRAFQVGGADYMTKPFQSEEVLARVEMHLALRASREHLVEQNRRLEQEIEARKEAHRRLKLAATVFENTTEGVVITDTEGVIESVNPAFTAITGYSEDEVVGEVSAIWSKARRGEEQYEEICASVVEKGLWKGEFLNCRKNGQAYPQETLVVPVKDEQGQLIHYLAIFSDITERKKTEEMLRRFSFHDFLTGLANRRKLDEVLPENLERATAASSTVSVIMIDIDYFKKYNDNYGHPAGDACLQRIGGLIGDSARRASDLVVRYGGEEFLVLLTASAEKDALKLAEAIRRKVEELQIPHAASEVSDHVTISAGVGSAEADDSCTPDDLISLADSALYHAKEEGRNRVKGLRFGQFCSAGKNADGNG